MKNDNIEVFIKKYWDEEDTWFYLHFKDKYVSRQIEIQGDIVTKLSDENPDDYKIMADQSLEDLEYEHEDIITKEEFEKAWKG